jgi:NAD(P)-dependent dehydrogenase (short-subunit alcohol dehydrogenase family)
VVNSARSVEQGQALAAEPPDAIYVQADVSDETQARALVAATLECMNQEGERDSTYVMGRSEEEAKGLEERAAFFRRPRSEPPAGHLTRCRDVLGNSLGAHGTRSVQKSRRLLKRSAVRRGSLEVLWDKR